MIQAAADNAGLKLKAPEFIRDVCTINAGGRFATAEEIQKRIEADLAANPIVRTGDARYPFARSDIQSDGRSTARFSTYAEARQTFIKDRTSLAQQARVAIEMLPSMEVPGDSPMHRAVNLLRILAEQQGENSENQSDGSPKNENEFLKKLLSQQNLKQAKANLKEASQLSDKEQELLDQVSKLKKQDQQPPDNPEDKDGQGGKLEADGRQQGMTAKGKRILDNAINLADRQLNEVIRISRKLKAISKLRTSKITKFVPDSEGEEIRNRQMKSFDEISRLKATQFSQMTAMPKIFNYRAATNQHMIRERGKFVEKKQLLYVIVDCSGSMTEDEGQRINMAAGILVNRLMAVASGDAQVYWRFFDTVSYEPTFVQTKEEAHSSIIKVLKEENYDGGGTNFDVAISDAVSHIESLKETMDFAKPEIFMVTDGACSCHLKPNDLKGIKLHSALVANDTSARSLRELTEATGGAFLNFV